MKTARRGFLKGLAATPLVPAALASAEAPPPAAPGGNEAVAAALAEAVKRQFGEHLDAAELAAVRREIARNLDGAARLRRGARLRNADEPVGRFEARPPEGTVRGGRR
jgi:hypothetical protein